MKIVYRAGDITEAEIVRGMLLSYEIDAHVSGYYLQGGIGETSPLDLAKVHVADEDYESAKEVLSEYEGSQPPQGGTGSSAESGNSTSRPGVLVTILVVIAVAIFSFWVGV
ncbi:MAG: DUF2007 domain-containing protein [Gammaproteobacteria bacterium]|nr:DUF2007 domain-containing protein [Gammaproteobacteria bacterium]